MNKCPCLNIECDSDAPTCEKCTLKIQIISKCSGNHNDLGYCLICGYCGDHISLSNSGFCYNCGRKIKND